jgi:L-seryl-tRNA(Ser) seleniumtransferase
VRFINDLGSGLLVSDSDGPFVSEPPISVAVAEGADVVTFSGDHSLGGPQAGLIVGRADAISLIEKHPLMRAVRIDKLSLAALQATLEMYVAERSSELPLWSLASATAADLKVRAEGLAALLRSGAPDAKVEAVACSSVAGGGSLPGEEIPSWGVAVTHGERSVDELERALRRADTPVIARIEEDRLLFDLRTVFPHQHEVLAAAIRTVLK